MVPMGKLTLTAFRLGDEDIGLLAALAKKLGVARADVVRIAIRKMAESENVKPLRLRRPKPKPATEQ